MVICAIRSTGVWGGREERDGTKIEWTVRKGQEQMKTTKKSASQEPASGEALGDLGHEDLDAPRSVKASQSVNPV